MILYAGHVYMKVVPVAGGQKYIILAFILNMGTSVLAQDHKSYDVIFLKSFSHNASIIMNEVATALPSPPSTHGYKIGASYSCCPWLVSAATAATASAAATASPAPAAEAAVAAAKCPLCIISESIVLLKNLATFGYLNRVKN